MSALGFFKGKTVVVAGATFPLGMSLCHRLADLNATVVAMDLDDVLLASIARHAPDRIETLAIDLGIRQAVQILREAWASEPVHCLVNLMPLSQSPKSVSGLFEALGPALAAARGRSVSLFPDGHPHRSAQHVFDAAGWRAFLEAVALDKVRHRVLSINRTAHMSPAQVTSLGDLALMLCHPASDALGDGSRLSMRHAD